MKVVSEQRALASKVRWSALFGERQWLPLVVGIVAVTAYVAIAALQSQPGFPLDDGWIHQTYARNLVQSGRWEFVPGVVSAGSTAPLWTLLLALGYLLGVPYLFWSYLLGTLCLGWLALAGMGLWSVLWPEQRDKALLAGVVLVLTWPFVWAAVSGMETLLFLALGVTVLWLYFSDEAYGSGLWLGVVAGLLVLTRPEGLLLVGLVAAAHLLQRSYRSLLLYLAGTLIPLAPYFLFNLSLSGEIWPNTFYAKQTEYAVLLEQPFLQRLLHLLYFSAGGPAEGWRGMSSAHLLLAPGLFYAAWQAIRRDVQQRRLRLMLPLLWAAGHVFVYAWRLPVTYQHGRYLWAALPVWILYGLAGWVVLLALPFFRRSPWRIVRRIAPLVFALILLLFALFGAGAYATDVAFIQNEMVDVAHWIRENSAPDAVVAAHDIGAIGFFAERPLLDLAGLISPEVIPLLADEAAMSDYVLESAAQYLVTAPGWPYPLLTSAEDVVLLYESDYLWTRQEGLNNMAVYRLP